MSKHQEVLEYLQKLPIGKRVSVRSISNHLGISDGTAYRAIKEAENQGLVETRPRSGTVRIEPPKTSMRLEALTFEEIAKLTDCEVVAGHQGLKKSFEKFTIGAMTKANIGKYLSKSGLLIVGDRTAIQRLALESGNAILVTGGFEVTEAIKELSNRIQVPILSSHFDTFTIATMINQALSTMRLKTDIPNVENIYLDKDTYGYLQETDTVRDFTLLMKKHNHVRFPVVNAHGMVVGVVSIRDVTEKAKSVVISQIMTRNPLTTLPRVNLSHISQKMVYEDFEMIPVVQPNHLLLGVVTRRQVMEALQESQDKALPSYSDNITSHLKEGRYAYSIEVSTSMIDSQGNLAQGAMVEILKEVGIRLLTKKQHRNIIIEQIVLYCLQAVQLDDHLDVRSKIISHTRRSATIDFEVYQGMHMAYKATLSVKLK